MITVNSPLQGRSINHKEVLLMSKKIPLTVLSGVLATINPADAKITRCNDDSGRVTFTDSSCHMASDRPDATDNQLKQLFKSRVFVKKETREPRKIFFYCHSGTKPFTKC